MNVTTIGRRNVGAGLARLWRGAGHRVQELGREGGDAAAADVLLIAVPGLAVDSALSRVRGIAGKPAIDATNAIAGRPEGYPSLAHWVKRQTGGPVAKAFDTVFAAQYDHIATTRPVPSCLWCGDDELSNIVEQLIRDTGLDPVRIGGLEHAAAQEDFLLRIILPLWEAREQQPFFYRIGLADSARVIP